MLESPPQLSNSDINTAISVLTDPNNKDLFTKIDDEYLYWDKVKYLAPPGVKPEVLWHAVKLRRSVNVVSITFGRYRFHFTVTGRMQSLLHEFDMNFGGNLGAENIIPAKDSNMYLVSSLMEEAIASSKMEGASTTRKVAKDMLRRQSKPINRSQQMILNNYTTIRYLVAHKEEEFSVDNLKNIHRLITNRTLDNPEDEGRFRRENSIYVVDEVAGEIAHTPPDASELDELILSLCSFANTESNNPFVHPIIKGIIIHFMLAYFHPFIDGNGRTARSLVYWYLLKKGYWLTEYLSISRIIYRSKSQYEKSFLYTEKDGLDLSYFIYYNLSTMQKAYDELKLYLQKKIREQEDYYRFKGFLEISERQARVIRILAERPSALLTVKELTTRFSISPKTARADLQHLVTLGLIKETPVNKRTRGYVKSEGFDEVLKKLTGR